MRGDAAMRFFRDLPQTWRRMNGWLKAGLVWLLACGLADLVAVEIHARTPGHFNAPRKVAVRKAIAAARLAGVLLLLLPGLYAAAKQAEQSEERDESEPSERDSITNRYCSPARRVKMEYTLWIEAEEWSEDQWNPHDDNTDVIVTFADRRRWVATFFSYANIGSLVEKFRRSGENLSGKYFWATDMLLVDEVSRARIEEIVAYLLEEGEFHQVFDRVDDEEPD